MLIRVLLYGYDTLLLTTRELLLRQAGFEVTSTADHVRLLQLLSEHPFEIVILCHSLPEDECRAVLTVLHSLQPPPKTLLLTARVFSPIDAGQDVTLSIDGPRTLLAEVRRLSQQHGHSPQPQNPSPTGQQLCPSTQVP